MLEQGGNILKIEIENMHGNINNYETHEKQSPIIISENNSEYELMKVIHDLKNQIVSAGDDYEDLKLLLEELEKSSITDRITIKNRITNWMSQAANIITVGSTLYNNRQGIFDGVQQILNLLS